jgi:thiol-disulfide isomerase/thioredoxin
MEQPRTRRQVLLAAGGALALAGCVGGNSEDGSDGADDGASTTDRDDGASTDGESAPSGDGWQTVTLEDVRTGEQFAIADIDEPVVMHTFATWCSTCKRQQETLASARATIGEKATFVDVTIDENDDPEALRSHAESNGFDWRFAVAPNEMTRDLVDEYGQRVAIAPQSPVIVVCPDGSTQTLSKGSSVEDIEEAVANCQ